MSPELETQASPIVQALDTAFRYLRWLALLLAVLYLATGITTIQPDEEAIVLTLGRRRGPPKASGLLVAWPYPIDEVIRVPSREAKRLEVKDLWHRLPGAAREGASTDPLSPEYVFADEFIPEQIDPTREGYCITGDKDILQAYVAVKYRISDPVAYKLGQVEGAPEELLRSVVMSALTHALGEMSVDEALRLRGVISGRIQRRVQERLDAAQSGIRLDAVELVYLHPPRHVIKEFQEVTKAMIEASSRAAEARNQSVSRVSGAEAASLSIVTRAENEARQNRETAKGRAAAFRDLLAEYRKNPLVVASRLYRESTEEALGKARLRAVTAVPGGRTTVVVDFEEPIPTEAPRP